MKSAAISAAVITFNEEDNIERCLDSVRWTDETVLVDSGSTDDTVPIAREFGAKIFHNDFVDFSQAKQYAIDQCSSEWILLIDADEEISPRLRDKIQKKITTSPGIYGYKIKRISEFLGKKILHGEWGSDYPVRLFQKAHSQMDGAVIHESVQVSGRLDRLHEPIYHYPYRSMNEYTRKINTYSQLVAEEMLKQDKKIKFFDIFSHGGFKFFQSFILKAGFLDGGRGLLLSCFLTYYVMLKYTKAWEMQK